MTTPQLERLAAHCQRLRLYRVQVELPTLLEQAAKKDVSYADFLDDVLTHEVQSKTEKHLAMRVAMARFPFQKTLEGFDWKFQPSIEPKVIKELATGRFIADGENVLLLGPPGVGKTHCEIVGTSSVCGYERCMLDAAVGGMTRRPIGLACCLRAFALDMSPLHRAAGMRPCGWPD